MGHDRPSVLVTGGAKRIGGGIARAFGRAGWHVVVHYHGSAEDAEATAADLPSGETILADLGEDREAEGMIETLAGRLTDWRVLVNCASVFEPDDVAKLNPETNRRAMQINARSPARMAQTFLAKARAQDGKVVIQVTDQKLSNPNPDFFSYTMSKHALDATIAMLATGATQKDDRVYGLAPGAILASHDQGEDEADISHRMNLLRRRTGVEEVAAAALFLAGGHLESGQTLYVDSGQHLLRQERDVIYLAREVQPK